MYRNCLNIAYNSLTSIEIADLKSLASLECPYYNTQADIDMEAVAAAKEAIENYTYTVKQDTANTKEEVENRLIVTVHML